MSDPVKVDVVSEKTDGADKTTEADNTKPVSICALFRFATGFDWLMLILGILGSFIVGAAQPAIMVLFGDVMNAGAGLDGTGSSMMDSFDTIAERMLLLGLGCFIAAWIGQTGFATSGTRQGAEWRKYYLKGILRQDVGWYDCNKPGELSSSIAESTQAVEEGISSKLSLGIRYLAQGILGMFLAFWYSWDMALVLMALSPLVMFGTWFMTKSTTESAGLMAEAYASAGGVASETISSLRTVASLGAENQQASKYNANLVTAQRAGVRKSYRIGFANGLLFSSGNFMAAAGFIYGAYKMSEELKRTTRMNEELGIEVNCQTPVTLGGDGKGCEFTPADMIIALFALQMGAQGLGLVEPAITAFAKARKAAGKIAAIVDRIPVIDAFSDAGRKLDTVRGDITFTDVQFTYPARPDHPVCKGYNLEVKAGETVALCGPSGSGKSTAIQLCERFYDPDSGSVKLDGVDLKELNVSWLRNQIGLVGQEPVLFGGSIADNIAHGKAGATREEVEEAAKMANAHEFIKKLASGYDTDVGEKGGQLSGGQKQRIAIARAIIKNPAILLLDEATSALDNESEKVVQAALDNLATKQKRTTIVIAHRLSTIRNADKICVVSEGKIVEQGTHEELMAIGGEGIYFNLNRQGGEEEAKDDDTEQVETQIQRQSSDGSTAEDTLLDVKPEETEEKTKEQKKAEAKEEAKRGAAVAKRVKSMHESGDKAYFLLGSIGALLVGGANPGIGIVFVKSMFLFYGWQPGVMMDDAYYWSSMMFAIAVLQIVGDTWRYWGFGVPGEKVTVKLRQMYYDAIVRQEIGWHDMPENASGKLCANLASEVNLIQALSGETLGRNVLMICTLLCAFAFSFIWGYWVIVLVALATVPIMTSGMMIELAMMSGGTDGQKASGPQGEGAGRIVGEVVTSIRTIASFTLEKRFTEDYFEVTDTAIRNSKKRTFLSGLSAGYAQGSMFGAFALLYWFGGKQIVDGKADFESMFIPIFCMFMLGAGMGQAANGATDVKKATQAGVRVFEVVDRQSKIDFSSQEGKKLSSVSGKITFTNVSFTYPSRPKQPVCQGYNLTVEAGQTVALCGPSGSGKSTAIQLCERFYDPSEGTVALDGVDLKELNVHWLRSQIGLVGQEPVLFSGTIRENISYGKPGATSVEVEEAAKMANAHEFIMQFPDGYETDVGDGGNQLSGGQKQRVAIARAIIKNPAILLLDEATSALDNESEKVVQAALDDLMVKQKRTTIVIAHRLSTIRNADKICVVNKGKIVEQGTHEELMAIGEEGFYFKLHSASAR